MVVINKNIEKMKQTIQHLLHILAAFGSRLHHTSIGRCVGFCQ